MAEDDDDDDDEGWGEWLDSGLRRLRLRRTVGFALVPERWVMKETEERRRRIWLL
jgi:hypothetical protein